MQFLNKIIFMCVTVISLAAVQAAPIPDLLGLSLGVEAGVQVGVEGGACALGLLCVAAEVGSLNRLVMKIPSFCFPGINYLSIFYQARMSTQTKGVGFTIRAVYDPPP
ncbi:uncharacterized protein MELLADRAFT_104681 [Melampsora larici-populina 98AG31]|uniref:Secreted protein n=1 Tax=Melampsora larici-populina (strain 98AG31 / pathotype 3-4-7) TaxID=747676 RepID=F4RFJ7_MELLP|nr:uncharacterized protein MELLADRAFT_104681 [Melampsora larici-populina 98AG31]EGG08820.1 hypothetical protein MELLADRAFT_104681 [Melampsora larici-populina 98AG31]